MDKEQARRDALSRARRKRMGRAVPGAMTRGNVQGPGMSMADKFRLEQRRRLMNKNRNTQRGMVAGAAVSVGKKNKDKIKKKIQDIGNMKVKDAAKKIAGGVGALTPVGIAQRVGKALERKKQPPRQEARPRDLTSRLKDIRDKIKEGKIKPIPMPKVKEMTPLGKMKKPRPGTYDYQLLQTQKPGYRVAPMLVGGQAKIAKKAPPFNKINAKDFEVLRAEKAKGRGMGLQDEKMKPGKVTKAALGILAAGLSAKKRMEKKKMAPVAIGGIGVGMAKLEAMKKILGRNKGGMGEAKGYKKYLSGLERVTSKTKYDKAVAKRKAMEAGRKITEGAVKAAKATRIGKIAAGVAAVGLGAKEFLKRKMEKNKNKPQKKMGGGMMQRPMMAMGGGMMPGYKKGKSVMAKGCKLGRKKPTKMYT